MSALKLNAHKVLISSLLINPSSSPPYSVSVSHSRSTPTSPRLLLLLRRPRRHSHRPTSCFLKDLDSGNRRSKSRLERRRGARGSGAGFSTPRWLCISVAGCGMRDEWQRGGEERGERKNGCWNHVRRLKTRAKREIREREREKSENDRGGERERER